MIRSERLHRKKMKGGEATKRSAQIIVSFVRKEGTGRGNVLNAPSVGSWRGNPNQPPIPCKSLSNERFPCTDQWGQVSAHFQISLNPSSLLHRVTLNMADRRIKFSVDTGTTCSVLTWPASPLSNHDCTETGVDSQKEGDFCLSLPADSGPLLLLTPFLYMPECPFLFLEELY